MFFARKDEHTETTKTKTWEVEGEVKRFRTGRKFLVVVSAEMVFRNRLGDFRQKGTFTPP